VPNIGSVYTCKKEKEKKKLAQESADTHRQRIVLRLKHSIFPKLGVYGYVAWYTLHGYWGRSLVAYGIIEPTTESLDYHLPTDLFWAFVGVLCRSCGLVGPILDSYLPIHFMASNNESLQ
jgi:hypothetical protein